MKKKVAKKSSKKAKINYRQFAIGVFAFFLFAFLLGFVNVGHAATSATVTGHAIFGSGGSSFISDFFTNWQGGSLDINIAKYLLFFILTLLIFSVLRMTNFPPGSVIQFVLSIVVSFLAIAYITPEEVFVIVSAYTSLGVVITTVVPFLILCLFTTALVAPIHIVRGQNVINAISLPSVLLSMLMWLFFCGYSIYRLVVGLINHSLTWPAVPMIIMLVVTFVSILFLFFHKGFMRFIASIAGSIMQSQAQVNAAALAANRVAP